MAVARTKSDSKIRRIGKKRGATLRDVRPWHWVKICSQHFKKEGAIMVPSCTEIIKTSHGRERAPQNPDWYYIRCAAVLRAVYLRPGVGYGGLSKRFSSKKSRGSRPEITVRGSRGLLHWCCKSLVKLGLLEKCREAGHRITNAGRKLADTIAFKIVLRKMGPETEAK